MRGSKFPLVALLACAVLAASPGRAAPSIKDAGDTVTQWTLIADFYGRHTANWRTLAIMHRAMHDALNAAQPTYARWSAPAADEPPAPGATPQVAMAAAAHTVLLQLHPDRRDETEASFQAALAHFPDGPGKQAGIQLGSAIGSAAVQRRADDGFADKHDFAGTEGAGHWRPTPTSYATSATNDTRPFLFASAADVPGVPPPELGSKLYAQQQQEAMRLGALDSAVRTPAQALSAEFWAEQSSQRGFAYLAVKLFAAHPRNVAEEARVMSQLTSALADSAILIWGEKEKYSFWRPITALQKDGKAANAWRPLVETPPFPEYPSGHAADCFTGAGVLAVAFPHLRGPVVYVASTSIPALGPDTVGGPAPDPFGMGQHAQPTTHGFLNDMSFPSLPAAATDCAMSRIWAGAHFRAADDEAKRVADIIVRRAVTSVPPLK